MMDPDTKQVGMGMRWYVGSFGRFTSRDVMFGGSSFVAARTSDSADQLGALYTTWRFTSSATTTRPVGSRRVTSEKYHDGLTQ